MEVPGPRAVREHGEVVNRVAQPLEGIVQTYGGRREVRDLAKERLERRAGGDVEVVGDARELRNERSGAAREVPQAVLRAVGRRELQRARGEGARQTCRLESPGADRRALFGRPFLRRLVAARGPLGAFELANQAVERREVSAPAPSDARTADLARHGAARRRVRGVIEPPQGDGPRRDRLAHSVGGEALRDPCEKGERGLSGPAVGDGDAAGERARDSVLARELPRQGRIDALVGVEDLDVIERDSAREATAEDLANLVFLADRADERDPVRAGRPPGRLVHGQPFETVAGEPFEEKALELGELRVGREEVDRRRAGRKPHRGRAGEHVERVDEAAGRERIGVAGEHPAQLRRLAAVHERRGGDPRGPDAGRPQLVERALHRAMQARPIPQGSEIRIRGQRLRAGLLDEGEGLRAGQKPKALAREPRSRGGERQRAHRLDSEVHPGMPLPRQPLDERVPDGKRWRNEDLLLQRPLRADARERFDQPRSRRRGRFATPLGLVEGEEGLFRHEASIHIVTSVR